MIAVAFVGIVVGYVLLYSGITNRDPRKELVANVHGGHAAKESSSTASDAPSSITPSGNGSASYKTGKLSLIPLGISTHPGILTDKGTLPVVKHICATFNVKVSSGYGAAGHVAGSDHRCGLACDFVGSDADLRDLWNWANAQGFAYVEPWEDSMTVGRLGTTGKHVHISFGRCGGK